MMRNSDDIFEGLGKNINYEIDNYVAINNTQTNLNLTPTIDLFSQQIAFIDMNSTHIMPACKKA